MFPPSTIKDWLEAGSPRDGSPWFPSKIRLPTTYYKCDPNTCTQVITGLRTSFEVLPQH